LHQQHPARTSSNNCKKAHDQEEEDDEDEDEDSMSSDDMDAQAEAELRELARALQVSS